MTLPDYTSLGDLAGKRVLVRSTLDISAHDKTVAAADTWRIDAWLPFIDELAQKGARVIIMGHRGRPGGTCVKKLSLKPVFSHIKKQLASPVSFSAEAVGDTAEQAAETLTDGEVLVLENLRFYPGEKENSKEFAGQLAHLGDVFINNDFATSHRKHASLVGVAEVLPSAAGPLVLQEIETLSTLRSIEGDELVVVMGGAKTETKIPVIDAFACKGNKVLAGGVIANMLLKAEGYAVGKSVLGDMKTISTDLAENEHIFLPKDVVVSRSLQQAEDMRALMPEQITPQDAIVDIGPKTVERFTREIQEAQYVLWNGPLGLTEVSAFRTGSHDFARAFVAAPCKTIVGGGDVITFLVEEGLREKVDIVLTSGGAMLSFLAGKLLPGITVLKKR